MRPRSTILLFVVFLFALIGCGEDKKPTPPDDTLPAEGRAGRPDPPPPEHTAPPPQSTPADSLPLPIYIFQPITDPPPTLYTQIRTAADLENAELKTVTRDDLDQLPEHHILIAPLPLPPDFPDLGKKSHLILVGTPNRETLPPHITHIHPDDHSIGTAAGIRIIAELARQSELRGRASITGNIVQIRASDEDPASQLRHLGILEILDRHAGVIFVHDGPGFWREADAEKRMEEALRIQKNIRYVFAHSDVMAAGARSAIAAYRKSHPEAAEIPVLGVGIEGGDATAKSISLPPLAQKALEIALELQSTPDHRPPAQIKVRLP